MPKNNFQANIDAAMVQTKWQAISQLTGKDKYYGLKSIGNLIGLAYKNGNYTVEQLAEWLDILKTVAKTYSSPENSRIYAKIISSWLTLTGNDKATVLSKTAKAIAVETGTMMIGDPSIECDFGDSSDKALINLINQQQRFIFATGGDGLYQVQLRIIDALEPVLTPKEYKLVKNASSTGIIQISSGKIRVGDLGFVAERSLEHKVEAGNYKIAAYKFSTPKGPFIFYIVLCKTDQTVAEPVSFINNMEE